MAVPKLQKAIFNETGTKATLTHSKVLSTKAASKDYFTVNANGSLVSISSLEVTGSTIESTLSSRVDQTTPFKISYTNPSNKKIKMQFKNSTGDDDTSLN